MDPTLMLIALLVVGLVLVTVCDIPHHPQATARRPLRAGPPTGAADALAWSRLGIR